MIFLKKVKAALFVILFSIVTNAQIVTINGILRDTSYTSESTTLKLVKDYPFIKLAKPNLDSSVTLQKNIAYYSIGKRHLHLDLFLPSYLKENFPVVIIIHGGGWHSGNKEMEWPSAVSLAKNGFGALTVEYRLSPESKYPAGVFDLKTAVKWIKINSEKYSIDSSKIAVMGYSAGGELAAFLGVTAGIKKFEGNSDKFNCNTNIQAVIDVDGILDFTNPAESDKDQNVLKPSAGKGWFGASFNENADLWIEASPMNYVSDKTPPFLFINSSQERFHAGRDYTIEKMSHFQIYSEVKTIPDTPHSFWLFHPWFDVTMSYAVSFLNRIFKN